MSDMAQVIEGALRRELKEAAISIGRLLEGESRKPSVSPRRWGGFEWLEHEPTEEEVQKDRKKLLEVLAAISSERQALIAEHLKRLAAIDKRAGALHQAAAHYDQVKAALAGHVGEEQADG